MKRVALFALPVLLFAACAEREKPEPAATQSPATQQSAEPTSALVKLKGIPVKKPLVEAPAVGTTNAPAPAPAPSASASAK